MPLVDLNDFTNEFFARNPQLESIRQPILDAALLLTDSFRNKHKLLTCGNGGSAADADHIVGELVKSFMQKRPLSDELRSKFIETYGPEGEDLSDHLQVGLPAISLGAHSALISAFANDVRAENVYAQQVLAYANPGDVLLAISTSGNAGNVIQAARTAKVLDLKLIALSGKTGGALAELADIAIIVPLNETYLIQEEHIKIYHFLCSYIEFSLFAE
jgi:D-sedoheptulose 7-phosphate isomerase